MNLRERPNEAAACARPHETPSWEHEWRDAAVVELVEAPEPRFPRVGIAVVAAAVVAALLPAIFPLSPGYAMSDTTAQVVAALVAAAVAVAVVPFAALCAPIALRHRSLVFAVAALSAGAAAIHFAVAKSHFEEYFLYGLFFVLSGIAQLVWALLIMFRPARSLLVLGAVGNLVIVAVWAIDRIWGLPIGPTPGKPEPVGFSDVTASGFEVALAAGCLALLVRRRPTNQPFRDRRARAAALTLAVIGLTAMGLLSAIGVGSPVITPSA